MMNLNKFCATNWLYKVGLRPTKQRILLANLLMGDGKHQHFTAEDLFEKAKICFEDALRINPNQNKLGLSLALQGLGRYEEAIDTVVWMVNKPREFQIS